VQAHPCAGADFGQTDNPRLPRRCGSSNIVPRERGAWRWTLPWFDFLSFVLGAGSVTLALLTWYGARILFSARVVLSETEAALGGVVDDERDRRAREVVEAAKARVRWQATPYPEWVRPLVDEVPRLVMAIAQVYHPDSPNPVLAPGLSRFARAVELTAADIGHFLQNSRVGRLVDVSAHTAHRAWHLSKTVQQHPSYVTVNKWYRYIRPAWQAMQYNSPLMWVTLTVSNVAVRTLQPSILNIVARRAIQLYGHHGFDPPLPVETLTPEEGAPLEDFPEQVGPQ